LSPQPTSELPPLPSSLEAERAILGAVLLAPDNKLLREVAEKINSAHFFSDHHQRIFSGMLAVADAGRNVDAVTLTEALREAGNLGGAGGPAYLALLTDGVPRVSNVEHYISIVLDKYRRRALIRKCHSIEQQALEGLSTTGEVYDDLEIFLRGSQSTNGHKKHAVIIDSNDLIAKDLKPREFVTDPIFSVQGLLMLYAWRGIGKTYLTLAWAAAVAAGFPQFGPWKIPERRRCVYVDGEMAEDEFQERVVKLRSGFDGLWPARDWLKVMTPDEQLDNQVPNIGTAEGQREIERFLEPGSVLWLDSLSTLLRVPKEDDEAWFLVQEWLLRLRQKRISVAILHHSGKSGTQRGTSKREDFLNTVITVRRPADYEAKDGLRGELHFEKTRGFHGEAALPYEVKLEPYGPGGDGVTLAWRPLTNVLEKRAIQMFVMGMSCREVGEELGKNRFWANRIRKKWQDSGGNERSE